MKTYWLKPETMKTIILVCQLFFFLGIDAQILPAECAGTDITKRPENSDIVVTCGTKFINLSIDLCPIYNANYNETLMILNDQSKEECKGTADFNANPPVLKFLLSLDDRELLSCGNVIRTFDVIGTGDFSEFSKSQYVNVSGIVVSHDPTPGMITYLPSITYLFSCQYPLQYVLNNTLLAVAGVNLAINDNNGSFISTLSMKLFRDADYLLPLLIPSTGLNLKEKIYVEVTATNLTDRFNVLLDQCFATVDPYGDKSSGYDLFVGCDFDSQTQLEEENGASQRGRFSFEAFRFVEHKNLTVSTFYIHCKTRLCNVTTCASLLPDCNNAPANVRKRRDTSENSRNEATVTSPPILVGQHTSTGSTAPYEQQAAKTNNEYSSPVVAVIVCVAVLSLLLLMMGAYFMWNLRQNFKL